MKPRLMVQLSCKCVLTEYDDKTLELTPDEGCLRYSHFDAQGWPKILDAAKAEILMDER